MNSKRKVSCSIPSVVHFGDKESSGGAEVYDLFPDYLKYAYVSRSDVFDSDASRNIVQSPHLASIALEPDLMFVNLVQLKSSMEAAPDGMSTRLFPEDL